MHVGVYLSVFAHEALVCLTYMFMPVAFLQPVCSATLSDSDSDSVCSGPAGSSHPSSQPRSLPPRERPG